MSSKPTINIIPQGAIIQSFGVGPKDENIVQGFPDPALYKTHNAPYFGETIGRYANRIKGATFEANGGQTYSLAANNGAHSLHGGNEGWGKKDFTGMLLWLFSFCHTILRARHQTQYIPRNTGYID
jgi:aldose 1-epimerase